MFKQTIQYWRGSEVLTREEFEELSDSPAITFGDANHTLVTVKRVAAQFEKVPLSLMMLKPDELIDLES